MMAPVAFYKKYIKNTYLGKKIKFLNLLTFKFAFKTNNMKNKSLLNK